MHRYCGLVVLLLGQLLTASALPSLLKGACLSTNWA